MKKPRSLYIKLLIFLIPVLVVFTAVVSIASYSFYYTNTKNLIDSQILSSSYQFVHTFNNYFDSVIDTSGSIERKILNRDLYNNEDEITQYFDDIIGITSELISVSIYSVDGDEILFSDSDYVGESYVVQETWFTNAMNNQLIHFFSPIQYEDEQYYGFTLSKHVNFNTEQDEGVLRLDFDFTDVVDSIDLADLGDGGHISIYDNSYQIVYISDFDGTYSEDEVSLLQQTVLGNSIIKLEGIAYSMYASTLSNTRWKVVIFTNYQTFYDTINNFLLLTIIVSIVCLILEIVIVYIIASQITNPIRVLTRKMANVETLMYDSTNVETVGGNKEVLELSNSFNAMMQRINELAKKSILDEREKRLSELKALQNQINPHFLYNTLDSVIFLISKNENAKAEETIIALSKFFRISISRGRTIIPLENEIEHVMNYLKIQKLRFGKSLEYEININTDIKGLYVIKLILQPLVENSIVHGFDELDNPGRIKINVSKENKFIRFDIIDNGYGILESKIKEIYSNLKNISKHDGVGIKNVYQRLKIYYGEEADLKIVSVLDKGTNIQIFIPIDRMKSDEEELKTI